VTIKRETILSHRRVVNKPDYVPTREVVRMLCDGALELLDQVDGGQDQRNWEQERYELDKQVQLALFDMRTTLLAGDVDDPTSDIKLRAAIAIQKALYLTECIQEMVHSKLRNRRKWEWYRPRIEEEFG
jgi:hypothetical protein